jgi:hypothetical protein
MTQLDVIIYNLMQSCQRVDYKTDDGFDLRLANVTSAKKALLQYIGDLEKENVRLRGIITALLGDSTAKASKDGDDGANSRRDDVGCAQ